MIAVWIIGVLFIIAGYFVGIRRIIKAYKYRGKTTGVMLDCENSTGTGKQSVRVRYKYTVNGVEFIGKSEWLNNGIFYPGKIYEVKYHSEKPEKSYLKTIDRVIQGIIGIVFFLLGIGIIMLGFVLTTVI